MIGLSTIVLGVLCLLAGVAIVGGVFLLIALAGQGEGVSNARQNWIGRQTDDDD